jgi:predicted secreted protein
MSPIKLSLVLSACLMLSLLPSAICHAGDAARFEVLGFSETGSYFAFEQYGIQDGSGAAYSWIDFYDVNRGRYADETRRITVGGREGHSLGLEQTRNEARRQAAETLAELGIRLGNAGKMVLMRPLTDLSADSTTARFSVWPPLEGLQSQDYSLELDPVPATSKRCYFDEEAYMFDLHLIDNASGSRTLLHRDEYLPESRNCALAYRIAGVVVLEPTRKRDVHGIPVVVLINVFSTGFEGHDMRFTVAGGHLK